MNNSSFKILMESLGCSVVRAAPLLGLVAGTARKYANNERRAPVEVIRRAEDLFCQIEDAADAFQHAPERLIKTRIPRGLHRAILRRIQEKNIIDSRRKR